MAALSYHYGDSAAWLHDLPGERDPHAYDLCEHHVARLRVPSGWSLEDHRTHSTSLSHRLAG